MRTYSAGIVTAYGSAKAGGYTGTYAEFCEALGQLADVLEDFESFSVVVNTLPEGSSATASYADGVLTLGIPKGDKGDKGDRGATGNGIVSIVKTGTSGLVDTYTITYTDGNTETFTVTNGAKGDTGEKGDTGNGIESVELTSTSGAVKTYTITFTDGTTTTFDVTDGEVTNESLAETLEDYAKIDGYYEEMSVGDAEQLVATQYVEDSEPYLFRTTGGSADVGNREYVDEIVGGSVAWNQLISIRGTDQSKTENGVTITDNRDGTFTVQTDSNGATANTSLAFVGVKVVEGHKYLWRCTPTGGSADTFYSYITANNVIDYKIDIGKGSYIQATASGNAFPVPVFIKSGTVITTPITFKPQFTDMTLAFGPAIADYLYTLETAIRYTGINKLLSRGFLQKDYYPYNAGELISVSGLSSHDTVGFNQWDEEWVIGNITSDGILDSTAQCARSKNYISVKPNATYCLSTQITTAQKRFAWYDIDHNFIQRDSTADLSTVFTATSPSNAAYALWCINYDNFTAVTERIINSLKLCVNLSWSGYRNGEYEEYQKHSYALDDSLTLRGILKLDSSNNLYYDGDTYASDGTVMRKYDIVDLGTLDWLPNGATNQFYASLPVRASSNAYNGFNVKYPWGYAYNQVDKTIQPRATFVWIADSSLSGDATALKNSLNGVYLVYELETPTTETADPYQQVQICDDFGTEEFVTTSIVPVGHNTRYPDNLRDKLQHLPHLADSDGYYMISQQNNSMSLELFRIPKAPTTDGTYVLRASVSGGTPTYTWEAVE